MKPAPKLWEHGDRMTEDDSEIDETTKRTLAKIAETALEPAAKEIGKGLTTVAKAINIALFPLEAVVWGYEEIRSNVITGLQEKLSKTDASKIIRPDPRIAVPTIEALKYVGHDADLREIFTSLLASSMHADYSYKVHPAFVHVINQLGSDEAKLLKHILKSEYFPLIAEASYSGGSHDDAHTMFQGLRDNFIEICNDAGINNIDVCPIYFDNLRRLNLIEVRMQETELVSNDISRRMSSSGYDEIEEHLIQSRYEALYATPFCETFIQICIEDVLLD